MEPVKPETEAKRLSRLFEEQMTRILMQWPLDKLRAKAYRDELKRTYLAVGPQKFTDGVTRCIDEWTGFTPTVGEIRKFIPQEKPREHVDSPAFDYEAAKREHEKNMQDPEWRAAMAQLSSAFKNAKAKTAESQKSDEELEARRAELRRQAEEIGKRFGGGNA